MGSNSTLIYTSELILCFTICVLSATRHNIHMYPYFKRLRLGVPGREENNIKEHVQDEMGGETRRLRGFLRPFLLYHENA